LIEGEPVTPMLLAKRFTLNPILVVLSLVFWFWMWGVTGAILAVPMLAITRIICDRIQSLAAHLATSLKGDAQSDHSPEASPCLRVSVKDLSFHTKRTMPPVADDRKLRFGAVRTDFDPDVTAGLWSVTNICVRTAN
jgi:hypothetical protein